MSDLLEELSDKVRKGEPIGFLEAIAVIDYQKLLKEEREYNKLHNRFKRWFKSLDEKNWQI